MTRRSKRRTANQIPLALLPTRRGAVQLEPVYADRRPGRPDFVSPDVLERFLTALRGGNTRRLAALFAGLNPRTVENWMHYANSPDRLVPGGHANQWAKRDYVQFQRMTIEAEAAAAVLVTGNLVASSRNPVAALAWLRQRQAIDWQKDPEPDDEYAPVLIDARQQTANVIVLDPSQYPELVSRLLEAKREARAITDPNPTIIEATNGTGIRHTRLNALRAETDEHPA